MFQATYTGYWGIIQQAVAPLTDHHAVQWLQLGFSDIGNLAESTPRIFALSQLLITRRIFCIGCCDVYVEQILVQLVGDDQHCVIITY